MPTRSRYPLSMRFAYSARFTTVSDILAGAVTTTSHAMMIFGFVSPFFANLRTILALLFDITLETNTPSSFPRRREPRGRLWYPFALSLKVYPEPAEGKGAPLAWFDKHVLSVAEGLTMSGWGVHCSASG